MKTATVIAALLFAAAAHAAGPSDAYGKESGIIPGVVLGPRLSLLSVPSPSVAGELKIANLVGASVDYGLVPDVEVRGVKVGLTTWKVGARVFPFRGRFFLGASYGSRTFHAKKTVDTGESGKLDVTSTFVAPELGWRFVWRSGFFMGLDLGWQIVLDSSKTLTASAGLADSDRKDIDDAGRKIGKAGLPELGLLQLGWYL